MIDIFDDIEIECSGCAWKGAARNADIKVPKMFFEGAVGEIIIHVSLFCPYCKNELFIRLDTLDAMDRRNKARKRRYKKKKKPSSRDVMDACEFKETSSKGSVEFKPPEAEDDKWTDGVYGNKEGDGFIDPDDGEEWKEGKSKT